MLDWRNRTNIAIIIVTATVATVFSGTVITSGAIVAVGSVVGVPTVVFVRRPGVQETFCCQVLLGRLVIILLFRGGVMPFLGHIVVVIFIFQFPIREELEVFAIG
jgi:hypothetical protein